MTTGEVPASGVFSWRKSALAAAGIILLALNLRITIGSVGVLLDSLRRDLDMSASTAGVLTTLPLVTFATVGFAAGVIVRKIGLHRTAIVVLVVMTLGLVLRALASDALSFLLCTTLALCAVAIGNVILPPLVKEHFPGHIALVSSLYGAAIMAGVSTASTLTVPLSDVLGSWRAGLGAWAVLALVAALPWLRFLSDDRARAVPTTAVRRSVLRSRTMWALALCFGFQSAHAYMYFGWYPAILVDAGLDPSDAGLMLGLITGVGIPLTLCLPLLIRWLGTGITLPVVFGAATMLGWAGVLVAPTTMTWAWSLLLGLGGVSFTWTLTMIGRRSRTPDGTAALSGPTQGIGYLIAAVGPLGAGLMHDATGSWDLTLVVFTVGSVFVTITGVAVARSGMMEDEVDDARAEADEVVRTAAPPRRSRPGR